MCGFPILCVIAKRKSCCREISSTFFFSFLTTFIRLWLDLDVHTHSIFVVRSIAFAGSSTHTNPWIQFHYKVLHRLSYLRGDNQQKNTRFLYFLLCSQQFVYNRIAYMYISVNEVIKAIEILDRAHRKYDDFIARTE